MRPNRRAVALCVFVIAAGRAANGSVGPCESSVFRIVNRRPESWRRPIWAVMQAGSLGAVGATSAVVWARHDRSEAARIALVGTAVWAGVKLVKPLVGRGRPAALLDDVRVRGRPQAGLGFPSGHAAVAATLALLVPWPDPRQRRPALGCAVVVGLARMYVGAHLPLDVLGGLAIGTAFDPTRRPTRSRGVPN